MINPNTLGVLVAAVAPPARTAHAAATDASVDRGPS